MADALRRCWRQRDDDDGLIRWLYATAASAESDMGIDVELTMVTPMSATPRACCRFCRLFTMAVDVYAAY